MTNRLGSSTATDQAQRRRRFLTRPAVLRAHFRSAPLGESAARCARRTTDAGCWGERRFPTALYRGCIGACGQLFMPLNQAARDVAELLKASISLRAHGLNHDPERFSNVGIHVPKSGKIASNNAALR